MGFNCVICKEREVWIREAAYMFPGSKAFSVCSDCYWDLHATNEQKIKFAHSFPFTSVGKISPRIINFHLIMQKPSSN